MAELQGRGVDEQSDEGPLILQQLEDLGVLGLHADPHGLLDRQGELAAQGPHRPHQLLDHGEAPPGFRVRALGAGFRIGGGDDGRLGLRQLLVDLFGHEGQKRVKQPERLLEDPQQQGYLAVLLRLVLAIQDQLARFEVPVAEVIPEELVRPLCRVVEAVLLEGGAGGLHAAVQAVQDPPVHGVEASGRLRVGGEGPTFEVHEQEARGVPDLVGEPGAQLEGIPVHKDVLALGGHERQGELEGVGAVLLDHLEGIDAVAEGLGHLAALHVPDQAVNVHVREGNLAHELQPHHDHPGDPEEDDVVGRDQGRGGVEALEVFGLLRPAQGRERPQGRGEPGVQNVRILVDRRTAAGGAGLRVLPAHGHFFAIPAVPHRDAVAPPQLAGNAPVADVAQPVGVGVLPALREEAHLSALPGGQGLVGQGAHADEPLIRKKRLDQGPAAVAVADRMQVPLFGHEQPGGLEVLDHSPAPFENRQAAVGFRHVVVESAVGAQDVDAGQVVADADLVVVGVVPRGHLDHPGAELPVHVGVLNHGQPAVGQGQEHLPPGQPTVALVLGVHRHRRVAEHGLGPGGGDFDRTLRVREGIAVAVHPPFDLFVLDLVVRDGGAAGRAPVDQVVAPVDQALFEQADEHLPDRCAQALVEGEALALPVAGAADALQLPDDLPVMLVLDLPGLFDELLPPELGPGEPALAQLPFHDVLGRDPGVIAPREPQGRLAGHAVIADQDILEAVVQTVAHVQHACDIGRRNDDHVRRPAAAGVRREEAPLEPEAIQAVLEILRVVGFGELDGLHREALTTFPVDALPAGRAGVGHSTRIRGCLARNSKGLIRLAVGSILHLLYTRTGKGGRRWPSGFP